jgi:hypothetical protein
MLSETLCMDPPLGWHVVGLRGKDPFRPARNEAVFLGKIVGKLGDHYWKLLVRMERGLPVEYVTVMRLDRVPGDLVFYADQNGKIQMGGA